MTATDTLHQQKTIEHGKKIQQNGKDALAVKWTVARQRNYLIGAPKFILITAHKSLIPMFNKVKPKLPTTHRKMDHGNDRLWFWTRKNELDPLDYISRHPIPESHQDNTEQVINHISHKENAETLDRLRTETKKDNILRKLISHVIKNDWIKAEKDLEVSPYKHINEEIGIIEGVKNRGDNFSKFSTKEDSKIRHSLGHQRRTKTKQLLKGRYCFPKMNNIIDINIDQCYECKVVSRDPRPEPIKPTVIPKNGWEIVNLHFGGPYPDGHYNLVMVDHRSRYLVVEEVNNTSFKETRIKLKKKYS